VVAKVGGKAFAFIGDDSGTVGVKCGRDAAEAAEWRDRYPDAITVSAYIGRYAWKAVDWTGGVPDDEVLEWSTPPTTPSSRRCPQPPAGRRTRESGPAGNSPRRLSVHPETNRVRTAMTSARSRFDVEGSIPPQQRRQHVVR
jgi:hypothetical protein